MAQTIQTTTETGAGPVAISRSSRAELFSLAKRMGDRKTFRDPDALRSQLQRIGDTRSLEVALAAIIAGPPKAMRRDFAECLGRLSLHFWRPDFTPEQAKLLYEDFAHDMQGVTADELRAACQTWRTDPLNNFFPTPGKLLEIVKESLGETRRVAIGAEYLLSLLRDEVGAGNRSDVAGMIDDIAQRMSAKRA